MWLSSPENVKGLRKLRPPVELHPSGKARALATEQKRHVHPDLAMRHEQCRVCWVGAVKRPSCKWKGQTVADDKSTGGAGSPISRMPQSTKGGLRPTHQPILLIHLLLIAFFRLPKQHNTLRSSDNILPTLLYQFAGFLCIFSGCVVVTFSVIVYGNQMSID